MNEITPLLALLRPGESESLLSLMQRHCEANATHLRFLLRLLARDTGRSSIELRAVAHDTELLHALERRLGLSKDALAHLCIHAFPGPEKRLRRGNYELSQYVLVPKGQPVCPQCLTEEGYARAVWDFVQAPVCTRHRTPLLIACQSCGESIGASRSSLCMCSHCGFDLRDSSPSEPISERALAVARFVQTPTILSGGVPSDSAPLDPQDLSDILRLATLPSPGLPWDYALVGSLHNIPTQSIIRALDLVGEALTGRHLDTKLLRSRLLERWPYCWPLPLLEQTRLLKSASSLMAIPRETSNLLCFDSEDSPDISAAETYGAHIPRLFTRTQVEDFLQVGARQLDDLIRGGLTLNNPAPGNGYDMDEVLAIERTLPTVMGLEAADLVLGIDWVGPALAELKLLPTLRDSCGYDSVHPASLTSLLSRLWLMVERREISESDSVPLRDAVYLGCDSRRIAWVVAQALSGSLPLVRWEAPHNLGSLFVERKRLLELVNWPDSEFKSVSRWRKLSPASSKVTP